MVRGEPTNNRTAGIDTGDEHGSGLDRTEANFCRIRTVSDCNFFQNWRIRTDRTEKIFVVL